MRKIYLLLCFLPLYCQGQDGNCGNIQKTSGITGITYSSPNLKFVSVVKQIGSGTSFFLHLHFGTEEQHYDETGVGIEFEDGTIMSDDDARIECAQEASMVTSGYAPSVAHSGEYIVQGIFHITEDNIQKLTGSRIKRIIFGRAACRVKEKDAQEIISYIACLKDKRQ